MQTRAVFGFHFQTACLSVAYFDRFLSKCFINVSLILDNALYRPFLFLSWVGDVFSEWKIMGNQAFISSMPFPGCKDGGGEGSSPLRVSDGWIQFREQSDSENGAFGLDNTGLENGINYPFYFSSLLHHEIVPGSAKWYYLQDCNTHISYNERSLEYINFSLSRFCNNLIFVSQCSSLANTEINLLDYRPSTIAAAATLVALDQRLTRKALEWKMNSISYCGFLEIVRLLFIFFFFCQFNNIVQGSLTSCWDFSITGRCAGLLQYNAEIRDAKLCEISGSIAKPLEHRQCYR